MLTINQLMRYLRSKHHITVKSNQSQALRNMGYYHGFKGYRFIRTPNQRIAFSSFDEVSALNSFDMKLKALFYPKVMFIETALKSYVIEATLKDSHSIRFLPNQSQIIVHLLLAAEIIIRNMPNACHSEVKSIMRCFAITVTKSKPSTTSLMLIVPFQFGRPLNL